MAHLIVSALVTIVVKYAKCNLRRLQDDFPSLKEHRLTTLAH